MGAVSGAASVGMCSVLELLWRSSLALAVTSVRRNLDGSNADLPWAIGCKLMVSVGMCPKLVFLGGILGLTVPVEKCCPKFELLCESGLRFHCALVFGQPGLGRKSKAHVNARMGFIA